MYYVYCGVLCVYYVAAAEGRMQRVFGCFLILGQETVVAVHRSSAKQIQPYYTNTKHAGKASKIFYQFGVLTLAQIIWFTTQMPSKSSTRLPIEILLDVQQSYFSATGRLVDIYSFQWTSSRQLFFCYQTSSRKFLLDIQQKILYQTSSRAEDLGQYI